MKLKSFLAVSLTYICIFNGCKVDNTQKIFDKISISSEHNAFVFLFADQGNYFSDDTQDTVFNKALAGNMSGVNAQQLKGMVLYPDQFFDASLSTQTAESFLHLFDNSGNNTFSSYPSVFTELTNYQKDFNAWKHAIDSTQKAPSVCGIGLLKQEFGSNINIYAKIEFYAPVSDSVRVAVYLVENSVVAPQRITSSDTSFNYLHQHVLVSALNGDFGETITASALSGNTYKLTVPFSFPSSVNKNNIEYLAVVYQYHADKPLKILNCSSLK